MPIRRNIGGYITANPTAPTLSKATGVWGLVQQLQASAASIWPFVRDPDFDYVSLLLPGNGTNGAQNNTFLDSSTNNFTITRNGDTTQGSFSPYGDLWSNYFDNSGDSLSVPDNAAFNFGTGDFTVEAWVYLTQYNSADYQPVFSNAYLFYIGGVGQVLLFNGSSEVFTGMAAGDVPINAWTHIAWVRSGSGTNNTKVYVNGVQKGQATLTASVGSANPNRIGQYSTVYFPGYISNLRVVKGTAVYTSNFTPPTAPLTAISGTSLLTCQSNRFRDASSNNFAITANGDVRVTNFAPFNPTAAYDPATNGGSGYFDGSGDYLTLAYNTAFNVPGDFTIEAWVYQTARGANSQTVVNRSGISNAQYSSFELIVQANGTVAFLQGSGTGTSGSQIALISTAAIPLNAWTHIAGVKNGSTSTLYVNGVQAATGAAASNDGNTTSGIFIGTRSTTDLLFTGYINGVRLIKGTALYTSNFTPPTAPVTAVANTQLLCNFTNAGIVDASAKNDLVTVGNAQISTAQSKFGGSSMYFDGTGDYLSIPDSAEFDFGTGNFTVEAWVYHTTSSGTSQAYFTHTTGGFGFSRNNAGALVASQASVADITSGGSIPLNAWTHIAVCRTGTSLSIFINGAAASTVTNNTNFNGTTAPQVGAAGGSLLMNGYIDDLRITKGVARYTANFTPPTAPFPPK